MRHGCSRAAGPGRGTTLLTMLSRSFAALLLLVVAATGAEAQWVWRDRNGRITASDLPPPREIPDQDVLQRPEPVRRAAAAAAASAASAPPLAAARTDPELEASRRAAENEKKAKAKADEERLAAQRAENCRRARAHLNALDSGQRLARINENGEREFLDDQARAAEARRAREAIAANCR